MRNVLHSAKAAQHVGADAITLNRDDWGDVFASSAAPHREDGNLQMTKAEYDAKVAEKQQSAAAAMHDSKVQNGRVTKLKGDSHSER